MTKRSKAPRWWQSIPKVLGVVTGTATALAGLLVTMNQLGWLKSPPQQSPPVAIPRLLSPPDQTTFYHYPRTVTLAWEAVPNANGYKVQIQFYENNTDSPPRWSDFGPIVNTNATTYTFDFIGAQPGRWRIWAVDANGREGLKSDWWSFFFAH